MRHRVSGYKLGRDTEHRTAMFRNLAAGVIQHGQITTTLPKAKAVQSMVEKLITLARKGDLTARRRALAILNDRRLAVTDKKTGDPIFEEHPDGREKSLIQKLFDDVAPRYADRAGGYTRIIKLAKHRLGDGGALVILQLVGDEEGPSVKGRFSRRRRKQDNRTAYAAKLRKGETDQPEAEAEAEAVSQAVTEQTAEAEPSVEPETAAETPEAVSEETPEATAEETAEQAPETPAEDETPTDDEKKD